MAVIRTWEAERKMPDPKPRARTKSKTFRKPVELRDEELHRRLKSRAAAEGILMRDALIRAIEMYLQTPVRTAAAAGR